MDYLLIMTVNPGFAGQKYLPFVDRKIRKAAALKAEYGYQLAVDGAISPAVIRQLAPLRVDAFVLGTSAPFGKGNYQTTMNALRAL